MSPIFTQNKRVSAKGQTLADINYFNPFFILREKNEGVNTFYQKFYYFF